MSADIDRHFMKLKRVNFESVRILFDENTGKLTEKYEKLVNLVAEYGGRVHGSQHNFQITNDGDSWDTIAVYFQIPSDARDEFEKEYGH